MKQVFKFNMDAIENSKHRFSAEAAARLEKQYEEDCAKPDSGEFIPYVNLDKAKKHTGEKNYE